VSYSVFLLGTQPVTELYPSPMLLPHCLLFKMVWMDNFLRPIFRLTFICLIYNLTNFKFQLLFISRILILIFIYSYFSFIFFILVL
jgi:hypothetical protein